MLIMYNMYDKYYWGEQDTSVDFCEEKYKEVFWIGEYYNTISAFLYILVGVSLINTRISRLGWGIIVMGIGSILLHGTLRYYGQWVDELGMLTMTFMGIQYKRPHIKNYYLFILFIFYLIFTEYFFIFVTLFTLLEGYFIYISLKCKNKWGILAILFFVWGIILWGLDKFLCYYTQPYHLHAWWHFLTSLSLLFTGIYLLNG